MALLQDYNKLFEYTDNIKKIYLNNSVVWPTGISSTPPGPDYTEPFYVENISNENETLSIVDGNAGGGAPFLTIEYSTDRTTWQTLGTTSTTALTITLAPGDKVYLRCSTNVWAQYAWYNKINGVSKVGGNIMSLLYGSNFTGQETSFPDATLSGIFNRLFYTNTRLVDASSLLLPATVLTERCYASMFDGCTALTQAPALPATILTPFCYRGMFISCTSLAQAPALPATTIAGGCYADMFNRCTSLTQAPDLIAPVLVEDYLWGCYEGMFGNCTSLNSVKCLATTNVGVGYTTNRWLANVSSTGTFTKAAGVTWPTGAAGIPSGWTIVEV